MAELRIVLRPTPPFRLELAAWTLRRRAQNAVDVWDGRSYGRSIHLKHGPAWVSAHQTGTLRSPRLQVRAVGPTLVEADRSAVRQALERLLGLRADLQPFYRLARRDARLHALARTFVGFKPPRFLSAYEALVNAIACQQLSLIVGITLLNRLSEACRPPASAALPAPPFPRPEDVLAIGRRRLRTMGFSEQKARSLLELSAAITEGRLDVEALQHVPSEIAREQLLAIRGIGRWSAEYVLLRGLGRSDVFPGDDVAAARRLAEWLELPYPLGYAEVHTALEPWADFAGLIYFHMLLAGLRAARTI